MRSPAPHPRIKQYFSVLQGELPADTSVPEDEVNSLLAKCFTEGAKKWLNLWVNRGLWCTQSVADFCHFCPAY